MEHFLGAGQELHSDFEIAAIDVLRGRGYEIVPQLRVAGYRIGFVIHPFGVRGVGEMPIVPPMAAVANAIADATGRRLRDLPMSPPRVLSALGEQGPEPQRLAAE